MMKANDGKNGNDEGKELKAMYDKMEMMGKEKEEEVSGS